MIQDLKLFKCQVHDAGKVINAGTFIQLLSNCMYLHNRLECIIFAQNLTHHITEQN